MTWSTWKVTTGWADCGRLHYSHVFPARPMTWSLVALSIRLSVGVQHLLGLRLKYGNQIDQVDVALILRLLAIG
ncbi:hypothetical protein CKO51_11755 [Rhodopirellula sp. SM50]|nr:hypothetical protein CKO51_11755 [Rhodopirellula sp. SM50]